MLRINAGRIFLYQGQCDMRRSFDRLARMVSEELDQNPLSGDLFVFLNRDQKKIKCLYWERGGYAIWYKRLEAGKFIRPDSDTNELDQTSWMYLLEGVEVKVIKKQPRYRIFDEKN